MTAPPRGFHSPRPGPAIRRSGCRAREPPSTFPARLARGTRIASWRSRGRRPRSGPAAIPRCRSCAWDARGSESGADGYASILGKVVVPRVTIATPASRHCAKGRGDVDTPCSRLLRTSRRRGGQAAWLIVRVETTNLTQDGPAFTRLHPFELGVQRMIDTWIAAGRFEVLARGPPARMRVLEPKPGWKVEGGLPWRGIPDRPIRPGPGRGDEPRGARSMARASGRLAEESRPPAYSSPPRPVPAPAPVASRPPGRPANSGCAADLRQGGQLVGAVDEGRGPKAAGMTEPCSLERRVRGVAEGRRATWDGACGCARGMFRHVVAWRSRTSAEGKRVLDQIGRREHHSASPPRRAPIRRIGHSSPG